MSERLDAFLEAKKNWTRQMKMPIRIVVMSHGWVIVGRLKRHSNEVEYVILDGFVIRQWGTSRGLGQLALEGPLAETKLDATPELHINHLHVLFMMDCDETKWDLVIK